MRWLHEAGATPGISYTTPLTAPLALDRFPRLIYVDPRSASSRGLGDRMVRRLSIAIFAVAVVGLSTGCVERRFRVESNPPGAYVYVNNVPYGPTPVDVPFLFYGDYDIQLQKDGYQTLRVKQPISTPWYEYPLVDFFSENFWPFQITDQRPLFYEMEPVLVPNLELLKAEGEDLRRRTGDLPKPRYPEVSKEKAASQPGDKKGLPPPAPPPVEALPPPRPIPGLPAPKSVGPQ